MAVKIGTVATSADAKPDKAQALKILEESAEVFSAWQDIYNECADYTNCATCRANILNSKIPYQCDLCAKLVNECADVIQAVCNMLAALGVDDLTAVLDRCKQKNIERGREYGL